MEWVRYLTKAGEVFFSKNKFSMPCYLSPGMQLMIGKPDLWVYMPKGVNL